MKKFVFLTILQLVVSVSFAQIKTPSTYRFTKKYLENQPLSKLRHILYFQEQTR